MKANGKTAAVMTALLGSLALNGCVSSTPEVVLEHHGDSVRNMIAEQTYTPDVETPTLDGDRSRGALKAYREDVADTKKVEQEVLRIKLD